MSAADSYLYWRNALAGIEQMTHENEQWPGFYYKRQKEGPRLPVAIWLATTGETLALVGFEGSAKLDDAEQLWTWVCNHPVSEEQYRAAFTSGQWPDDPPPVPEARGSVPGDNLPDDPAAAMAEELAGEAENAKPFLAKPIVAKEDADRIATWARRIGDLAKRADDARTVEKAPHLAKTREIDAKWTAIRESAFDLSKALKKHLEQWLIAQARAEERRRQEAEAEAARLRDEAARVFELDSPNAETIATALSDQADRVEKAAAAPPKNASAGRTGARVALRKEKVAVITDYDACLQALKNHPDLKALVEQLANRAVRAGVPLAGVETKTVEKAA